MVDVCRPWTLNVTCPNNSINMSKCQDLWSVSSQSSVRNWFSLCFSTPTHSPEFHVVAGLSPHHPLISFCSLHIWGRWSLLGQYWPLQSAFTRAFHCECIFFGQSELTFKDKKNVLNVFQLPGELCWGFENFAANKNVHLEAKLPLCYTVVWRNHWLHYQVLFSDWEHNKTSLDKQLKHGTKKGIRFSGPRWVVVFVSNLIFFTFLHFTHPHLQQQACHS